jgi:hypothetical protein
MWQVFDIVHRFNNLVLHHSFFGLGLTADAREAGVVWDVGPSPKHIHGGAAGCVVQLYPYGRLVLTGEALDKLTQLYNEHLDAFTTVRVVEPKDPDKTDGGTDNGVLHA